jgi:serine/threonine protein kinase
MTPAQIERVFGLGRLKMATGEHVEVFREAVAPGERRRYTKRFLATSDADFGQWTEREWRILARLIGHGIRCVPDVVQFDGGAMGGTRLVQTYDAGVTVDQWATLLPVSRDGAVRRHIFEDCAHWWALAHYCLAALDEIHSLQLVHLDFKGDNICIPYGPANFDPDATARLYPIFPRLALIDFAFSLVSRENLSTALPIGWQKDYDYQSPRLLRALDAGRNGDLQPTKELDWRCDLYSLAAMLKRYLPSEDPGGETGWTPERFDDARTLIFRIRECHDRDNLHWRPHEQLMDFAGARLAKVDLAASLNYGWTLARAATADGAASPITPMTRIAPSIHAAEPIRIAPSILAAEPVRIATRLMVPTAVTAVRGGARTPARRRSLLRATVLAPAIVALAALAAPSFIGDPEHPIVDRARVALDAMRLMFQTRPDSTIVAADTPAAIPAPAPDAERKSPSPDSTATPLAAPAVNAPSAPSDARAEPDAKLPSPMADQKALSLQVAKVPPKPGTPVSRPPVPSLPQSTRVTPRPVHALPRLASNPSSKPTRGPSIASASASGRLSPRQSSRPQQRFQPLPSAVQVAAARPAPPRMDSRMQAASPATEPPPTPPTDPAPDQRSPQPGAAANQLVAGNPTDTAVEDRRTPTQATAVPAGGVARAPNELRSAPSTATNQGPRSAQNPQPSDEWRTLLSNLGKLLRRREEPPAPVGELSLQATAPQMAAPRPPVRTPPNPRALASAQSSESPRVSPALVATEQWQAEGSPSSIPAPLATSPTLIADARVQVTPSEIPALPSPAWQPMVESLAPPRDRSQDALVKQARGMLADMVPRVATRAQPDVARVLGLAAIANHRSQQQAVVDAAYAKWPSDTAWTPATDIEPIRARRLHDDARQAFTSGRVSDAVNIELSAFAANPRDPDIAAYLAFLHLRMNPVQPEMARQLALYALYVSGSRRSARFGDWGTLAIASALVGRDIDATRAFFVEVALTSDLDRTCQTAMSAYASYGERLRVPVHAMLDRIDSSDRVSPYCEWPPTWSTATRW